ncbi:MAG: glycosyltransferase family 9 protein [Syntrophorhabdales bacterium]|jgi:lipopolysaccharide heptosyltransferase I
MTVCSNILVIRLSSLGDVLLTMPAVAAIKAAAPETAVTWLVEGSPAELLRHQGFIDRVIEFPRRTIAGDLRGGRVLGALRSCAAFRMMLREEAYDLVVDFHGIMKSALLAKAARSKKRIGFDRSVAKEASWLVYDEKRSGVEKRLHKTARNLLLASSLGVRDIPEIDLAVPADAAAYIDDFLARRRITRPVFAVNPFCSKGSEFKRWDIARYGEVARRVGDATGATMLILWGPGEEEEARRLAEAAGGRALLACATTVPQLLALLKRTDLYIGGDSGVMHLAAFARVPVVAIFGPTDHLVNGPYGNGHTVVRKELPCSPCRDKECGRRECLRSITVDEVCREVLAAWSRAGGR